MLSADILPLRRGSAASAARESLTEPRFIFDFLDVMPRVTIVLPAYNHERYLEQTLRSLFAQDYTDFQIVAINDGSADGSLDILNRHRRHVLVIDSLHEGPAAARNRGLRATDSEFVAFMDSDDLCLKERLRL